METQLPDDMASWCFCHEHFTRLPQKLQQRVYDALFGITKDVIKREVGLFTVYQALQRVGRLYAN